MYAACECFSGVNVNRSPFGIHLCLSFWLSAEKEGKLTADVEAVLDAFPLVDASFVCDGDLLRCPCRHTSHRLEQ